MFLRLSQSASKRRLRLILIFLCLLGAFASNPEVRAAYPMSELNSLLTPQEKRVDVIREQEIKQIQVILTRPLPEEQRADMLLRLAELYTEKYRLYFAKENDIWLKRTNAQIQSGKKGARPPLDQGVSKAWIGRALGVLRKIPTKSGHYSRMDEVYYFLGFHYWELGKKAESVKFFEKLAGSYPKSKFISEAYRHIADYNFSKRKFSAAKSTYEKALKGSDNSPLKPRILYGFAWTLFKLGENKRAADTMRSAIETAKQMNAEEKGFGLERDAVDALVLFYSEGGSLSGAPEYFRNALGDEGAFDALRKLAQNYQHQGKYGNALAINKKLLDMGGQDSGASEQQRYEILLDGLRVAGNKGQHDREKSLLTTMTNEFVVNSKIKDEVRVEKIRTMVRKAATLAHREGNKSRHSRQAYERAEDLYRLYLSAFEEDLKSVDRAEVHYYLADVLSQLGKHKSAAAEYKTILDSSDDSAFKKYQKDAAQGMIFSLDSYFKAQNKGGPLSKNDADDLVAAIDSFVRLYPNDKEVTKYLARATGILVTSKRMDEARPRLMQIVENYPRSSEALESAVLLMKDAEDRQEWNEVASLSEKFLKNGALMAQDKKGTLRKQLESVASRAKFKTVKEEEDNQDFAGAAKRYEKLAEEAHDSEVRYKALNNAAVNYAKAGDTDSEHRLYKKILALYPTANVGGGLLTNANQAFLRGEYADAAAGFESFYHLYEPEITKAKPEQQKTAVEALRSAAVLRDALKDQEHASEDYRSLVTAANKDIREARDATEVFLMDTARNLRDSGNQTEAIKAYRRYLSGFPKGKFATEAMVDTGILYGKLEENEKAQNYLSSVISHVRAKKRGASIDELGHAAHARLLLLKPLEDAFNHAPLRLPEAQLKIDIKNKLAALDRLNKGYVEVIEFGEGKWGMEAFLRMALAYRSFGQSLESAPIPHEFSVEEKAKFRAQLHNVAKPVFVKVGETLENALKKGEQLQVIDPVMAKIYLMAVVTAARPDRMPLYQEPKWDDPARWLIAESRSVDKAREALLKNDKDASAYVAVGNYHAGKGDWDLARIFYLRALDKKPKLAEALNNLAFLDGHAGNLAAAHAGFKAALENDEFAVAPKRNLARLYMASGLWRHANLMYRQLSVRIPNDPDVKRGLGLSYLALGRVKDAEPFHDAFIASGGFNADFADAIWKLAKGEAGDAHGAIGSIASDNEMAALLNREWVAKEDGT